MNDNKLSLITSSLIAGGSEFFTADGIVTNSQCAAMRYVSIRYSGLVVHAMPKIDFPIDAIAEFGYDYAQLSFSVDFTGCRVNSFTRDIEWAGDDCTIDTIFHKKDWNERPSMYGKKQKDGSVVWDVQGTKNITILENRKVTSDAIKALIGAMSTADKKAFLQAIFDEVRDYIEIPTVKRIA